ncbi:peptidase family C50-domain-containing protein [Pelagophyceae sp. CCMP2097]|nr:peptidase family C50-domain-containing protein [Pelagophyceae sp. CCMP2097]
MGHGAGQQYLPQKRPVGHARSAAMLMGCSSGRLRSDGFLEPRGVAVDLLAYGCPCVVANLWDVTDRDVDKLTLNLLANWVKRPEESAASLLPAAREECKLRYLNGAAAVVYGVPLSLNQIFDADHASDAERYDAPDDTPDEDALAGPRKRLIHD